MTCGVRIASGARRSRVTCAVRSIRRDFEGAGDGGEHLAGRVLESALDLGEVLRRDAGPLGRLRQRLAATEPQGAEALTQDLPPQRLGINDPAARDGMEADDLGHASA